MGLELALKQIWGSVNSNREVGVITWIVGIPLGAILAVWTIWITVTAFLGGQAPFFFIDFDGFSLIRGLFWLIVVDPIVIMVAYWIFMLIMLPFAAGSVGLQAWRNRKGKGTA